MSSVTTEKSAIVIPEPWSRLRTDRNPLRMPFTSGVWAAGWYLLSYMFVSIIMFCVIVTASATAVGLSVVWVGLPMLIGSAYFIRGCVGFERHRARVVVPEGLAPLEPVTPADGFFRILKAQWKDQATLRGLVHFVLLFLPLFVLNSFVFFVWVGFLGVITLPIWYRYIPETFDNGTKAHGVAWGNFPNGPHGSGGWGFWIGSDRAAIVAALVGLVLFLAWNYVLVATARLNVASVQAMISDFRDPLAAAKRVLDKPGPLSTTPGR
jgi:hypothetical protein